MHLISFIVILWILLNKEISEIISQVPDDHQSLEFIVPRLVECRHPYTWKQLDAFIPISSGTTKNYLVILSAPSNFNDPSLPFYFSGPSCMRNVSSTHNICKISFINFYSILFFPAFKIRQC